MLNKLILLSLFISGPFFCFSQKVNRYRNKEKQGKWIIYHDSSETNIDNIGRYRKGDPKGIWKYYDEEGRLTKKEKFRVKKIYTTFYHPNGKIQKRGKAKIVKEEKFLHYYFYGDWMVYDSLGTLVSKQIYKDGIKISEIYNSVSVKNTNDSIASVLRHIDVNLRVYFDTVQIAENAFGKNSAQYQRAVSLNNLHTAKLLCDLDQIILKYGYPGKTLVGNDGVIAFSIISVANLAYKEKYLKLIIEAANKGELEWLDVAYFVDKVKVAKKEKQVYCTQYKIDTAQGKLLYYPVEDIGKLNERRKKTGLDELDISTVNFIDY